MSKTSFFELLVFVNIIFSRIHPLENEKAKMKGYNVWWTCC